MTFEAPVLWDVVEEHLVEGGVLWERWERALASPLLRVEQVADGVEARLAANVEGLAVAGPPAVERLLEPALREGEPGSAFAAAAALLELPGGLAQVLSALAGADDERRPVLTRAFALSRAPAERDLLALLAAEHPALAAAGLEALALRGAEPGPALLRFLSSDEAALAVPALRAARRSTQPTRGPVERALQHRDPAVRDAALETGLRLGLRVALLQGQRLVEASDPGAGAALGLLAMSGDRADGARLEKALAADALRAPALAALGYAGWPGSVEALLAAMDGAPELAPIAGEAFAAITGIAIEGELLAPPGDAGEPPALEDDDLEADLAGGPEAELPVPDAAAVAARWAAVRPGLDPGVRHLEGVPFTPERLVRCFAAAPMRRRRALATELAVRSRGGHAVEPRDWAFEQLRSGRRPLAVRSETGLPLSRFLHA